jgi:flagellar protein FlbT
MPLKIILKNEEKIIVNGAVIQNIGGSLKALILNEAAVLREKDIITEEDAKTPASRAYFALQNLYLFPDRESTYGPLVHRFFTDFGEAAPSALERVQKILDYVTEDGLYQALRLARKLVVYEGSIFDHAQSELSGPISDGADGGQPETDGSLGPDRGSETDQGSSEGTG